MNSLRWVWCSFNPRPRAGGDNHEGQPSGVSCRNERQKRSPFALCGMKGKLWEPKP